MPEVYIDDLYAFGEAKEKSSKKRAARSESIPDRQQYPI